jgi:hypothetical protein
VRGIELIERIRASVIGDDTVLDGPFGARIRWFPFPSEALAPAS